jgi:hypothetical protein
MMRDRHNRLTKQARGLWLRRSPEIATQPVRFMGKESQKCVSLWLF